MVRIVKNFVIITGRNLCWGLFYNKVAGHAACNFRTPILKNNCERLLLNFWKVFCKNIFQIIIEQRELLLIGSCVKGCSNQSKLNKNAGNSLEKVLLENAENSFLHTSTKISENFDINDLRWSKISNPKKQKNILYEFHKQSDVGVL